MTDNRPRISALTFGVELEFALATLHITEKHSPPDDPHPNDPRYVFLDKTNNEYQSPHASHLVHEKIAQALTNMGIPALKIQNATATKEQHQVSWLVKNDISIMAPDRKYNYDWYPIEVVSPAYYVTEDNIKKVKLAVNTLSSYFRININRSCGLHIHIGNGVDGLSYDTVKKICCMLLTFDDQFSQIHRPYRVADVFNAPPISATPLWEIAKEQCAHMAGIKQQYYEDTAPIRRYALDFLLKMERDPEDGDFHNLLQAFRARSRGAYNFNNLGLQRTKKTIEFRLHESTLDAEAVEKWLRVCNGLVMYARDTSLEEVSRFCLDNVGKGIGNGPEECPLAKVLVRLGLKSEAIYYNMRLSTRLDGDEDLRTQMLIHPVDLSLRARGYP
ncbi:putative amidoligase enzyme-domain-containing protein [Bisporella sp. PMI_857]|nr:putative amidoligase enzyme-domain-containing protein [Bisporella sp. PMI_857]